jgi:putative inorganic carbon (hco3(-)) transporter
MQKLIEKQSFASISLILIITTWLMFSMHYPIVMLAGFVLLAIMLAKIIIYFRWQYNLLKLMALLLPFSFEAGFYKSSMILIPTEPIIVIVFFVMILEIWDDKSFQSKNLLQKEITWIIPLIIIYIFTIPFSQMIFVSAKFSIINLLYILVFFIYFSRVFSRYPGLFPELLLAYSAGLLLVLAWSLYRYWQWEWNPVVVRGIFRPFFNDHTIFGASVALLAAFWLSAHSVLKNKFSGWIAILMGLFFLGAVLLSGSRAALLSLVFFGVIYFLMILKIKVHHLIVSGMVLLTLMFLFRNPLIQRLQRIEHVSYDTNAGLGERTMSSANISSDISNIERMNRWVSAYRMFRERPLTGFGPGTFQFVYIPYQESSLMTRLSVTDPNNPPENSGGTAHSEYLLALSEMGIFGLLAWLIILGRLTFIAFDTKVEKKKRLTIIASYGALSTYIFHAFFNNFLTTDKFAFLFWGTAAWLIAVYHSENDKVLQTD